VRLRCARHGWLQGREWPRSQRRSRMRVRSRARVRSGARMRSTHAGAVTHADAARRTGAVTRTGAVNARGCGSRTRMRSGARMRSTHAGAVHARGCGQAHGCGHACGCGHAHGRSQRTRVTEGAGAFTYADGAGANKILEAVTARPVRRGDSLPCRAHRGWARPGNRRRGLWRSGGPGRCRTFRSVRQRPTQRASGTG